MPYEVMTHRMWRRGPDGEIIRAEPEPEPEQEREPAREGAPEALRRRASLGLALRLGLRDSYDHLGAVVLMSLTWAIGTGLAALGGFQVGRLLFGRLPGAIPLLMCGLTILGALVLVGGPLSAGVFRWARNAAARQEPEVFDLAWGFRAVFTESLALAAVQASVAVLLLANCLFYFSLRHPVWLVLGALFGYLLLFWVPMCHCGWPLLAEGERGTPRILRKSALLVLDNLAFLLGLGALMLLLSVILWTTMVGAVLLWAGTLAVFFTQATRELLRKYAVMPPDPTLDPVTDEMER